jgi:ADP-ribosyl-[dinitrogen reductase] hydrolase
MSADAITPRERYRGSLLGLAAGDALGTTLEFRRPGTFTPIADIVGGGPFRLKPGEWTDDTSMALCLADSLIACEGFDPGDQMRRYVRWSRDGYLGSNGHCFDIGNTVSAALGRFDRSGQPFSGSTDPSTAGNGSLMRLAPVPLAFAANPSEAIRLAGEMSRTTHGAAEAVDACRYYAGLIVGALRGVTKEELLSPGWSPVPGLWTAEPLSPRVAAVAAGSFREKDPHDIRGTGYVVDCLEAALWALDGADNFREACLRAVNLGDDADTTGAVVGQLAGALWGVGGGRGIPTAWVELLALRPTIKDFADGLLAMAEKADLA